jgi:SAM-dependent methyltransferase
MKAPVLSALDRLHLLARSYRAYEVLKSWRAHGDDGYGPDGLPLPPARLRVMVAGTADPAWFLEGGRRTVETIGATLAPHGVDFEAPHRILDFGCGCGRVARHWSAFPAVELYGSDYNESLVRWCVDHLRFATFARNGLVPPLDYEDEFFDVVYAVSVFTHLDENLQFRWLAELRRMLCPGGFLLLTTHGDSYLARLTPAERASYEAGKLVVRRRSVAGTNLCTSFHPPEYVRESVAKGLELLVFSPQGAVGNPYQDLVLLRKPDR